MTPLRAIAYELINASYYVTMFLAGRWMAQNVHGRAWLVAVPLFAVMLIVATVLKVWEQNRLREGW